MSLDRLKIAGLSRTNYGWEGACPACRDYDLDPWRDKLQIFDSGAYRCENFPGDPRHNRKIYEIAGQKEKRQRKCDRSFGFIEENSGEWSSWKARPRTYFKFVDAPDSRGPTIDAD
jgi:hypothetical protein